MNRETDSWNKKDNAETDEPEMAAENYEYEEETDEEIFDRYVRDLQLTPEDLQKKILDVGSYDSRFAKCAKEKGAKNIYSLEPVHWEKSEDRPETVAGLAQAIPFRDKTFDLVISLCAIPQIFALSPTEEDSLADTAEDNTRQSILEMLRIIKDGGEIRLGRIAKIGPYKFQNQFWQLLNKTLGEIAVEKNISAVEIDLTADTDEPYKDVLIKIRKKPT